MSRLSFFGTLLLLIEGAKGIAAVTKSQRAAAAVEEGKPLPGARHFSGCGATSSCGESIAHSTKTAGAATAKSALQKRQWQPMDASSDEESPHPSDHDSDHETGDSQTDAHDTHETEGGSDEDDHKQVTIQLYYETKCPDCVEFINQTLEPLWRNKELRKHLNISMNPYGNSMSLKVSEVSEGYRFWHPATTSTGWDFVHICQHGSDECLGNLIQACAINNTEPHEHMDLVFCMASHPDWSIEKASYQCLTDNGVDIDKVAKCVRSPEGNKMMAKLGDQTNAVEGRLGTPWVLVDGSNLDNVTALMETVCMTIGNKPSSCSPFKNLPKPTKHDDDSSGPPPDEFQVLSKLGRDTVKNFMKAIPKQI